MLNFFILCPSHVEHSLYYIKVIRDKVSPKKKGIRIGLSNFCRTSQVKHPTFCFFVFLFLEKKKR